VGFLNQDNNLTLGQTGITERRAEFKAGLPFTR